VVSATVEITPCRGIARRSRRTIAGRRVARQHRGLCTNTDPRLHRGDVRRKSACAHQSDFVPFCPSVPCGSPTCTLRRSSNHGSNPSEGDAGVQRHKSKTVGLSSPTRLTVRAGRFQSPTMERARRAQPRLRLRPAWAPASSMPWRNSYMPTWTSRAVQEAQLGLSFIGQPRGVDPRRVSKPEPADVPLANRGADFIRFNVTAATATRRRLIQELRLTDVGTFRPCQPE